MTPKISLVLPVFNGGGYLSQMLDSVTVQTFNDWELILVDDGSTDETPDICDRYASERIHVIHQKNGGVSAARNRGMKEAKGEYIGFVDADDLIEPTYLEHLSEGFGSDLIVAGFCFDNTPAQPTFRNGVFHREDISQHLETFLNSLFFHFPWARLFRRNVLNDNHLQFDTSFRFAEDMVFDWQFFCHAESVYKVAAADYHKRQEYERPYRLSMKEVEHIDGTLYLLKDQLEHRFNIKMNLDTERLMHTNFLKDAATHTTVSSLVEYYFKYHPEGNRQEALKYIATTSYYLSVCKASVLSRTDKNAALVQLKAIRHFLDLPWSLMNNTTLKSRWLIPVVMLRLWPLALKMVKSMNATEFEK